MQAQQVRVKGLLRVRLPGLSMCYYYCYCHTVMSMSVIAWHADPVISPTPQPPTPNPHFVKSTNNAVLATGSALYKNC